MYISLLWLYPNCSLMWHEDHWILMKLVHKVFRIPHQKFLLQPSTQYAPPKFKKFESSRNSSSSINSQIQASSPSSLSLCSTHGCSPPKFSWSSKQKISEIVIIRIIILTAPICIYNCGVGTKCLLSNQLIPPITSSAATKFIMLRETLTSNTPKCGTAFFMSPESHPQGNMSWFTLTISVQNLSNLWNPAFRIENWSVDESAAWQLNTEEFLGRATDGNIVVLGLVSSIGHGDLMHTLILSLQGEVFT